MFCVGAIMFVCSQTPGDVRWMQRRGWVRCVTACAARHPPKRIERQSSGDSLDSQSTPLVLCSPVAITEADLLLEGEDNELRLLLTDQRLVRSAGSRLASAIAGMVTSLLPACCDAAHCPLGVLCVA